MSKLFLRRVLPVLILLSVVAAVTYLKEFAGVAKDKPVAIPQANNAPPLMWNFREAIWDRDNFRVRYGKEFEKGTRGHYDFWVANPSDAATSIELTAKSCQCADVQLGIVPADAFSKEAETMQGVMVARGLFGPRGFDPSGLALANAVRNLDWQPMDLKTIRQIPAADAKHGQRLAILRMGWDAKAVGPLYITTDLNYYGRDRKASNLRFEVPISIVNPALVYPQEINVGDMRSGDSRPIMLTLWTASRDSLPLKLPDVPKDSCFVFGEPIALTDADRLQMSEKLHEEHPNQPPTKPIAGWRVPLTIHESYQGNQMDLGPFNRRLVFNQGTDFEVPVVVKGSVRGAISLASREADDVIKLGDFQNDLPKTHTTFITSANPDTKLEIESITPEGVEATLQEESPGTWRLKIAIPANKIGSQLAGSIVVRTVGPNPRKVRIPLIGNAYTP